MQNTNTTPRVAIIHFWLVHMRGGEKVLEALCRMYPQADIFTHVCDRENLSPTLQKHNIYTTFIQKLPFSTRHYQKYLPLMPLALEQLDLTDYDLVISSESGPAKGVITRATTTHVCYCHSPMRYLWDFYPQYLAAASPLMRLAMRPLFSKLRIWDVLSAHRVDHFVANAHTVARRIQKHWRREAAVVHPPVITERLTLPQKAREDFYLCAGQLVNYKRVDLAIEACMRMGRSLVIVGDGEERKKLETLAGSSPYIRFVGRQSDAQLAALYASAKALLFPGEEDFGLVPVEAMATGCPVLAYAKGGATETVVDGSTGLFFTEQNVQSLCACMESFEQQNQHFDAECIRAHALSFNEERFAKEMFAQINYAQKLSVHSV